jgi:hypothetical protein
VLVAESNVPLGWVVVIAVLAPAASLAGALWGARRAGTRQQYADESARNAEFHEAKRHAYSLLVAAIETARRDSTSGACAQYVDRREEALGYAKERRQCIIELLGDDPLRSEFDLEAFRRALFDDPGLA